MSIPLEGTQNFKTTYYFKNGELISIDEFEKSVTAMLQVGGIQTIISAVANQNKLTCNVTVEFKEGGVNVGVAPYEHTKIIQEALGQTDNVLNKIV